METTQAELDPAALRELSTSFPKGNWLTPAIRSTVSTARSGTARLTGTPP